MTEGEGSADVNWAICDAYAQLAFEDLPQQSVHSARLVLLDAVGVMLGATGLAPETASFTNLAANDRGSCRIIGTGRRADPVPAAMAMGALAHALDFEDSFDLAPGHPNASLVPALLALAQRAGEKVDGRRFLTALVAGCDLSCRLALALRRPLGAGGWYPPSITAGMGAALGAGKLLGCDANGLRDCLSLALCQNVMPGEIRHSRRTVLRAVREAFPAQSAAQSALLAKAGVAGFEKPIDGSAGFYAMFAGGQFDRADLLDGLGTKFWIEQLTFKPWPSCRGTHPFVEMALRFRETGVPPEEVARVVVSVDPIQRMLVDPLARKTAPQVVIDAKFSIPFTVATALLHGEVTLDSFVSEALSDAPRLALARKVEFRVVTEPDWVEGSGGRMSVETKDGSRHEYAVENARGNPANPLNVEEILTKFRHCAGRAAVPPTPDAIERLAQGILALEECEDVGALFAES